jgi:hypothetical protein
MGKIENNNGVNLAEEVLIELLGLGTPGAYVARVVSRVLTSDELAEMKGIETGHTGRRNINTTTRNQYRNNQGFKTNRQNNTTRYCILKVLNTRRQHLELGKHVPFGQAEPLRGTPPVGAGRDSRHPGPRKTANHRISSLNGKNSRELIRVRKRSERKLEHLTPEER